MTKTRYSLIVVLAAISMAYVLCVGGRPEPSTEMTVSVPETHRESGTQEQASPERLLHVSGPASRTTPRLAPIRRKVVLDRGPRAPGESLAHFEQRYELAREFDRFVAASRVSPGQQQRLLLALYDLQEEMFTVLHDSTSARFERKWRNEPPFDDGADDLLDEAVERWARQVDAILDMRERKQWLIHCGACWMRLYGMRILRLDDEE